jgi:hypothetical protein
MSWEKAKALAEKHSGGTGLFVKLAKNGDKITGVFCGDPYAREVVWTGKGYEEFDPSNLAHKSPDKKPTARVALNFYATAEKEMKVIEGGVQWFKDVLKVHEKYGQGSWTFEIERHGDANDTKTTYSILPDTKIDSELQRLIKESQLHDLPSLYRAQERSEKPASAPPKTVPFVTYELAGEIVALLKSLPKPVVAQFLTRFGVSRIRDLRANQEAEVREFIRDHQAAPADINPFE